MTQEFSLKVCPSCGAQCYSDLDVCFDCLHEFEGDVAHHDDTIAVGVVTVKKESAPEGALKITLRFDDRYTNFLAKSFSACS